MKRKLALFISKFFIAYYRIRYRGRVRFGRNVIVNYQLRVTGPGKLVIGDDVNMWTHAEPNGFHFYSPDARITIGERTRVNGVSCFCETSISIGSDCIIGSSMLMDTDFHTFTEPNHVLYGSQKTKPIAIGNHVWLCGQSAVLKGCTIGNGSVVGFRALVAKSFPDDVVIAGNPATILKRKE